MLSVYLSVATYSCVPTGPKAKKGDKYSCVCLHSDRNPQERRSNLEKFKVKQFSPI